MKLLDFKSKKWRVLLVYDVQGSCIVLSFLQGIDESLRNKMLRLLGQFVPFHGPPKNTEQSKHLQGKICEFKANQKRGPGLRVLYFQDENKYICTHAFLKDQRKTPGGEINRAETIRLEYLEAKRTGQLRIVKLG